MSACPCDPPRLTFDGEAYANLLTLVFLASGIIAWAALRITDWYERGRKAHDGAERHRSSLRSSINGTVSIISNTRPSTTTYTLSE